MAEGDARDDGTIGLIRQLRLLASTDGTEADAPPGWRDDLRLFVVTWAAGFVFFLIFLG